VDESPEGATAPTGHTKNVGLLLGVLPLLLAALRVLLWARGDQALLTTLVQTLNVQAVLLGSLAPVVALGIASAAFALIADPATWGPLKRWAVRLDSWVVIVAIPLILAMLAITKTSVLVGVALLLGAGLTARAVGRRWGRTRGKAPGKWTENGWALAVLYLLGWLATAPMWLPAEVVTLRDDTSTTAYVLSNGDGWATLLTSDRSVLRIPSDQVASRVVCNEDGGRSLLEVFTSTNAIPECPANKDEPEVPGPVPSPSASGD